MIAYDIAVRPKGAIWNGQASRVAREFFEDAKLGIAHEGADLVRSDFDVVHRHPTGYARSRVTVIEDPDPLVTDGGIIYGAWLEGVGSRNRTTRFKGYRTFRRMRQVLDSRATRIAQSILPPYLRRMNGR